MSEGATKGTVFIMNIYLARILGVTNFGIFSLAQATTLYIWLIVDLGIGMYGIREIARDRSGAGHMAGALISLRILSSAFFFLLYMVAIFLMEMSPIMKLTFACSGVYLLANSFYPDWVLKGLEKFNLIAFGSVVTSTAFLVSMFLFVKGPTDVVKAALFSSLSFLFGSVALALVLKRGANIDFRLSWDVNSWCRHLRESVYFTISGSFYAVYIFLPIILLQLFYTPFEVGIFSAPYRIILAVSSGGFLISAAFYPVLADQFKNDRRAFLKTHRSLRNAMMATGLPVAVIGTYLGTELTDFLFGEQYGQSALAFKLLVWTIPLVFIRYSYGCTFSVAGFQKLHNIVTITGVVIISIAGLVFIGRDKVVGAAEALLISELLTLAVMIFIYRTRIKPHAVAV